MTAGQLQAQVKNDSLFLEKFGLIDYSLLLVIEHNTTEENKFSINKFFRPKKLSNNSFSRDNKIYHFGIIDYLQLYNRSKKLERFFKGLYCDEQGLSVAPPSFYS